MKHARMLIAIIYLTIVSICDGFSPGYCMSMTSGGTTQLSSSTTTLVGEHTTTKFLDALDKPYDLNVGSKTRTQLLNDIIDSNCGITNPGSQESFASVAPGNWRVIYAPHMTFMAGLARGEFSVQVSYLYVMFVVEMQHSCYYNTMCAMGCDCI